MPKSSDGFRVRGDVPSRPASRYAISPQRDRARGPRSSQFVGRIGILAIECRDLNRTRRRYRRIHEIRKVGTPFAPRTA